MTDGNEDLSRRAFLRTATGAVAASAAAGTAAAQEDGGGGGGDGGGGGSGGDSSGGGSGGDSGGGGSGGDSGGGGGGGTKSVKVGPGGQLVFDPDSLQVTPGTTVKWTWESDNHNVVVESQPDGADWKGTEGAPSKTYNTGHTYSHTFETKGTYEYFCQPHKTAGMTGSVEVVESISTPAPSNVPQVPQSAKALGVATSVVMMATLGLSFFFLKYGGDYETPDE
jgi:plastocyanin